MKENKFAEWLAWKLPVSVVMWCFIRVMANATQGKWGNADPDTVGYKDAYDRFIEMNPKLKEKGF